MTREDAQALMDVLRMQIVYTPLEINPRDLARAFAELMARH